MNLPVFQRVASLATREIRLLPVLIVAAAALFVLKGVQIAIDAPGAVSGARLAFAQDNQVDANAGEGQEPAGADTAQTDEAEDDKEENMADAPPKTAEEAINARLSERRQELDQFETDLKMRENLLKAAEMRIEQRLSELKELENRLNATLSKREEEEKERFKNLVDMYQAMKPKDAAAVFDRLDTQSLVEVAAGIDPRTMAEIVSKMTPEGAERLTIALMNRATAEPSAMKVEDLPQIIGTQPN